MYVPLGQGMVLVLFLVAIFLKIFFIDDKLTTLIQRITKRKIN